MTDCDQFRIWLEENENECVSVEGQEDPDELKTDFVETKLIRDKDYNSAGDEISNEIQPCDKGDVYIAWN